MHRRKVFFEVNLTAIRTFLCMLSLAGLAQPFSVSLLCRNILPSANGAGVLLNIIPDTHLDPRVKCLQLPLHKGIRKHESYLFCRTVRLQEINKDHNPLATGNSPFSKRLVIYGYTRYCHRIHPVMP